MWKFYLLEAAIQVLWSLTPTASHYALRYWPVETYTALRFTLSGMLFLLIAVIRSPGVRLHRRDLPALVLLGILTYGIASLGTLYGLKLGGVVTFALASGCNAVITALAAVIVLRERWGQRLVLAIGLSLAGSILLAAGKYQLSASGIAIGSLVLVWAAYASEAMGFVFSRRFTRRYPLPLYLAALQLSAGIFLWVTAALCHRPALQVTGTPPWLWGALAFVVLISCGLCYAVHYWLLNYVEGHRLAFFDSVHAVAAATFGVWLVGERPTPLMIAGGALLVAAVYVVNAQNRSKRRSCEGR